MSTTPSLGRPGVTFSSLETLINALDGYSVATVSVEGLRADGVLAPWKPHLHAEGAYMICLREVLTGQLVMATDVRNLATITVL